LEYTIQLVEINIYSFTTGFIIFITSILGRRPEEALPEDNALQIITLLKQNRGLEENVF